MFHALLVDTSNRLDMDRGTLTLIHTLQIRLLPRLLLPSDLRRGHSRLKLTPCPLSNWYKETQLKPPQTHQQCQNLPAEVAVQKRLRLESKIPPLYTVYAGFVCLTTVVYTTLLRAKLEKYNCIHRSFYILI
jgi:hypothetical protein